MSTHNIHLKYRTMKRYPTVIYIVPPGVALIVLTFRGSNNRCLEQIFMVPKGFEPSKFDCIYMYLGERKHIDVQVQMYTHVQSKCILVRLYFA